MIIVTLVATLSAAMVWRQWRAVQVESAERARVQAAWMLSGALELAKLVLREDKKQYTALTEPWATPLAEARLSTFLAVDKANADDGPEAFLSGNITDAQARYNLNNLITKEGKLDPAERAVLERLCLAVGIETGIADRIATKLLEAKLASSASAPLLPSNVAQLTWLGVDAAAVQALTPYVVLLPMETTLNVNTASAEVLAAVIKDMTTADAARLVEFRKREPFKDLKAFERQLPAFTGDPAKIGVLSSFFEVRGRMRLVDRVLVERSLLQRQGLKFRMWDRERISSLEQVGG